jgi:hypothetical protein
MTSDLAVNALRNAVALRKPKGTIVHSDYAEVLVKLRNRGFACVGRGS